ncbi:alpha/beta hydrolase fold domain-containing protein [Promicromonospora sp. NPDC057138]|uniref:alpha/beta hydrolase fold domain-containing protein n=1 Tax=Promicromonospora sp. NPDC057138 TaxID=3346031 RepID=UPI003631EA09
MDQNSLAELRTFYASFGRMPIPDGTRVTETALGGVPALEVAVPQADDDSGVLLYLHGGGYLIGTARTGVPLTAALAARAGLRALSLDYRLAPEHQFPAAPDDALAAYRALLDDVDPARVVLAGDSAGGGLALATLLAARDAGLPLPAGLVAFSGWFDLTLSGASLTGKESVDPVFDASDIGEYADAYLPDGADSRNPLASPLLGDLRGLPPLLLQVGSHEVLLDDSTRLAARAAAADVEVTLETYPGSAHVFQHAHATEPTAARALDTAAAFLARHARLAG